MLHLKAKQNPNEWMIAALLKYELTKKSVKWRLKSFRKEQKWTVTWILPWLQFWLSSSLSGFSTLSSSPLLCTLCTSSPLPHHAHLNYMKFWFECMPWGLKYARSVTHGGVPFGMSLFNFRVLLFLCEWNVRNESHRVISQALTGLCHLSLDHVFTFGFLPCLGFWPIPLSPGNFTSQCSLWWRSLLPGVTFVTVRHGMISSMGFAFYYS